MKQTKKSAIRSITMGAAIAALYVVFTYISALFGLSSGAIQLRLSEALCILPMFTPAAVPGLFVGCLLSNLLTGAVLWDVIFGSIATLIGALLTLSLKRFKYLAALCPVLSNLLIVPFVIKLAYGAEEAVPFLMLTVGIGEFITCFILGLFLHGAILRYGKGLFNENGGIKR